MRFQEIPEREMTLNPRGQHHAAAERVGRALHADLMTASEGQASHTWCERRMMQAPGLHGCHRSQALSFRSSVGNVAAFRVQNGSAAAQRGQRQLKVSTDCIPCPKLAIQRHSELTILRLLLTCSLGVSSQACAWFSCETGSARAYP